MFRALCALTICAVPSAAIPQVAETMPSGFFIEMDNVEQLVCLDDYGVKRGTGVRVDGDIVLTAYHVVSHAKCTISGSPVETIFIDELRDVAAVRTANREASTTVINCNGFKRGETYFAIGWAFGEKLVIQQVIGTGKLRNSADFRNMAALKGSTYPGMSGGPIVDSRGLLVGIVNAGNPVGSMLSRPLSETWLCGGGQ